MIDDDQLKQERDALEARASRWRRAYGQALSTPAKAYMDDVERRQGLVETAGRILMGIGLFGGLAGLIALLLACSMRTRAGRIWSMLRGEGGVEVKHG